MPTSCCSMARSRVGNACLLVAAIAVLAILSPAVVNGQGVPLRINCGSTNATTLGGRQWLADQYYDSGEVAQVPPGTVVGHVAQTLRYFPGSEGGCYNVPLAVGERYLVRIGIAYRNYNGEEAPPFFDIKINGLNVRTLMSSVTEAQFAPLPFLSDYLVYALQGSVSVCFRPFAGVQSSPPQVNSLEFLPINASSYDADVIGTDAILSVVARVNMGGPQLGPEPQDAAFRLWSADTEEGHATAAVGLGSMPETNWSSASCPVASILQANATPDFLPANLFATARRGVAPANDAGFTLVLDPQNTLHLFYVRLYFAEVEEGVKEGDRRFDIRLGTGSIFGPTGEEGEGGRGKAFDIMQVTGGAVYTPVVVPFFFNFSLYAQTYGSDLVVALVPASDSALPPLLSGMEVFEITRTPKEGYVYRGLTPNDIAAIVVSCVIGAALMGVIIWLVVWRLNRSTRRYAIFGAGKHQRTGDGL